jgi:anti-sigma-K factor RskA
MSESPDELQMLAGEYVLGVLGSAQMRALRLRANEDARLAAEIRAWEARLSPLADAVAPVPPPPALWGRLANGIVALPEDPPSRSPAPAGLRAPSEGLVPRLPNRQERRLAARRVWPWQLATVASLALAAGIAAFALLPQTQPPMQMAALVPAGTASSGFIAQALPDGRLVVSAPAAVAVPAGHDLELWILPKGETVPKSLGVLPAAGRQIALKPMPPPGAQLMVSLEPPGGSPSGAPTGPVLFAGTLDTLSL